MPSPDSVPRILEEAGIAEDPALVHAVRSIAALSERSAPDASAELAQLMADGGRAPQSRRNKRRITFIGGALAVSMGAGMSGVAAGTLHLRDGFDDAVVSITRFTVRNEVDRAELAPGPLADAGRRHVPTVVPRAPAPAPAHAPAPAPSASAPSPSAPADAGGPPAPAPASPGAGLAAAAPTAPPVAPEARPSVGTALPADPATPAPDGLQPRAVPVTPPATGTAPGAPGRPDQARAGQGRAGQGMPGQRTTPPRPVQEKPAHEKPGRVAPGQARPGPVTPGQIKPGQGQPGQGQDRSVPKESTGTGPETISGETPAPVDHRRSWLRAPAGPADTASFLDAPIALDAEWLALFPADALFDPEDPAPELPAEPAPEELPAEPAPEDTLPVDAEAQDGSGADVIVISGPDVAVPGAAVGGPEATNAAAPDVMPAGSTDRHAG